MIGKIDTPETLSLIILVHDRFVFFKRMMDALISNTNWKLKIFIVDNNSSSKELKEYLISLKTSGIIDGIKFSSENNWSSGFLKGISFTNNRGNFLISDPDIIVPKLKLCWLEQLYNLFKKYNMDRLGIGLDHINHPDPPEYNDFIGNNDEIIKTEIATTLQIIKRKFFDSSNFYDNPTHPSRLMNRFIKAGGKTGFTKNFKAYHLGWDEGKEYPDYLDMKIKKYFHPEYLKYKKK